MTASKPVLALGTALILGASLIALAPEKESKLDELQTKAEQVKARDGKYRFEKGADYEIHEYLTPKGEAGYQIIYTEGNTTYSKGFGPEAKERTWEHTEIPFISSTST